MYRYLIFVLVAVLVLTGSVVRAQDQTPMILDDSQIAQIKTNCVATQSTLGRLHANDALTRVNLGQQYEVIATRLMAPMNSRIALNKLDGLELTRTAIDYKKQTEEFSKNYTQYEQTLSGVLDMKCQDQPVAFYDGVSLARERRQVVRNSVIKLESLTKQYADQFSDFRTKILSEIEAAR